jgi:hypothetical protein
MSWCVGWAEAGQLPANVPVPVPLEESAVTDDVRHGLGLAPEVEPGQGGGADV